MVISKDFLEVLRLINLERVDSIKLIDGFALVGKHVLMHEINEAALYQIDTVDMEIKFTNIMKNNPYQQDYQVSVFTRQSN